MSLSEKQSYQKGRVDGMGQAVAFAWIGYFLNVQGDFPLFVSLGLSLLLVGYYWGYRKNTK
ncbi:MAG: hypothetical protein AAB482_00670 [Patescibacteria group bacterium]|mgnify:CR=1 FL=1